MDSAKQEVSLSVVDENKQRDNDTYLGLLLFETADNDKYKTKGELPITMPKVGNSVNHLYSKVLVYAAQHKWQFN